MKTSIYLIPVLFLLLQSCSESEQDTSITGESVDWLIPESRVFDGGPGKDGIPSVDSPKFNDAVEIDFLNPDDLVIAVNYGDGPRAYPHQILDWHEIVNDKVGDVSLALTYCPLTGTGIGWDRRVNGNETTFGVSGLLYEANLLPYDRATDSNWSQMSHQCVYGDLQGTIINTHHVVEMSFSTFLDMYPDGQVMNTKTGFNRSYGSYPYGGYRTNTQFIFPIVNEDDRLHPKERVLGILIDEESKAYTFDKFSDIGITILTDQIAGTELVIVGSQDQNFMAAYNRVLSDGTILSFEAVSNRLPTVMIDDEGNEWDAFGIAVNGSRKGSSLVAPLNYIGYWFAWANFNPDIELY